MEEKKGALKLTWKDIFLSFIIKTANNSVEHDAIYDISCKYVMFVKNSPGMTVFLVTNIQPSVNMSTPVSIGIMSQY